MGSSRRDLLNDMPEHRSIMKNNRNTCSTCTFLQPDKDSLKHVFSFYFRFALSEKHHSEKLSLLGFTYCNESPRPVDRRPACL